MKRVFYGFVFIGCLCPVMGGVLAMDDFAVASIVESLSRLEQKLYGDKVIVDLSKKEGESKELETDIQEVRNIRFLIVKLACKYAALSVEQLLPKDTKVDSLSPSQKQALVMFGSQINQEGKVCVSNPHALTGAMNILNGDISPISCFMLKVMVNKMPEELLDGFELYPCDSTSVKSE
ncbi:MAG: hypothetical protein LBT63_02685 [Holosporaceae bacterium]|nr:hypothetical protein [Holosporaceae bacterium]